MYEFNGRYSRSYGGDLKMKVNLNIEDNWVEGGVNGKIVRRVMTLDEYDELLCEVCKDADGSHEIDFIDDTYLLVCPECAKLFMNGLIEQEDYTDRIIIMRL